MSPDKRRWALSAALVCSLCTAFRPVHALSDVRHSAPDVASWGTWGAWSGCSQSCGRGVMNRVRHCQYNSLNRKNDRATGCIGMYKQYKTCNIDDCPGIKRTKREEMCASYNNREYRGRRYRWKPYPKALNRCELVCQAAGIGFYVKLARTVVDGTPCGTEAICMAGRCLSIGCDGIVGSNVKTDKCGACGGDNSSCHIISGIFRRPKLKYGYNNVSTIPKGACNVNITEIKYSRNYLALKQSKGGSAIINGNWRVSHSKSYPAAGTAFIYHLPYPTASGVAAPGDSESITAKGPLTESVDIMVLAFTTNPGIKYEYTIPSVKKKHHHGNHHHKHGNHSNHKPTTSRSRIQNDAYRQTQHRVNNLAGRQNGQHRLHQSRATRQRQSQYDYRGYHQRASPVGTQYAGRSTLSQPRGLSRSQYAAQRQTQTNPRTSQASTATRQRTGYPHVISAYKPGVRVAEGPGSLPQGGAVGSTNPRRHQYAQQSRPQYVNLYRTEYAQHSAQNTRTLYPAQNVRPSFLNSGGPSVPNPYYQVQRNTGVVVPPLRGTVNDQIALNLPDTNANVVGAGAGTGYSWRISGFTKCSKTCGGGTQDTVVVCIRPTSQAIVTDDNCNNAIKPGIQSLSCNSNPCPPSWEVGDWSACSKSCDKGSQTRSVACKQRLSASLHLHANPSLCRALPKPEAAKICQIKPCVRWRIGDWGQCSAEFCGRGQRTREVVCVNAKDAALPENKCPAPKPRRVEICDMGSCAKTWFYSQWSKECSTECGEGEFTRKVFCSATRCNPGLKPTTTKHCQSDMPCGGKWFTGPWGRCTVTCGEGTTLRDAVCMKKLPGGILAVVSNDNCIPEDKPEVSQACQRPACRDEWYMTDWSQCSRSCNTGYKTREVKCLTSRQTASLNCNQGDKPQSRVTCNTAPCPSTTSRRQRQQSDPSCKDQFQNCRLVVQARLCKYSYYKQICCATCVKHSHHHHHGN